MITEVSETISPSAGNRVVHLYTFPVEPPPTRPIGRGSTIDLEVPAFLRRGFRGR